MAELETTADYDFLGTSFQLPAGEGRVRALGAKLRRVDLPADLRVDDRHVGVGADRPRLDHLVRFQDEVLAKDG